jgi:hypothetical protein
VSTQAREWGTVRERPLLNSNFLVDFGQRDPRHPSQGFAEVEFPPFRIHPAGEVPEPYGQEQRLILRRGVCGELDLYAWWHKARRGKAPSRRSLKIHLLAEDQETVVLTWHFHRVRPVCLSYSPLLAQEGAVLMETIELAYDSFEMFRP